MAAPVGQFTVIVDTTGIADPILTKPDTPTYQPHHQIQFYSAYIALSDQLALNIYITLNDYIYSVMMNQNIGRVQRVQNSYVCFPCQQQH